VELRPPDLLLVPQLVDFGSPAAHFQLDCGSQQRVHGSEVTQGNPGVSDGRSTPSRSRPVSQGGHHHHVTDRFTQMEAIDAEQSPQPLTPVEETKKDNRWTFLPWQLCQAKT
jgi:hypothetical protein